MLDFISKFLKKKVVIVVGDNAATIFYVSGSSVEDSLTVKDAWEDDVTQIRKFILKYSKLPVYILVDSSDQSINYDSIIRVKTPLLKKLIQRKIRKEHKKEDYKNYYRIADDKSKKNVYFVIADIANTAPLSNWVTLLEKLPVMLGGIYSLPVESENIAKEVDKIFHKVEDKKKGGWLKSKKHKNKNDGDGDGENSDVETEEEFLLKQGGLINIESDPVIHAKPEKETVWKLLVLQNANSGLRLVALKDNQVVFTRFLHFVLGEEEVPIEKAIQIKSQILGTIEYLKRIDYRERDGIEIFFLVSKLLQHPLKLQAGESNNIKFVDLEEASAKFFAKGGKFDVSKGADALMATFFSTQGKYLYFLSSKMKKEAQLFAINLSAATVLGIVALVTTIVLGISFTKIVGLESDIRNYQKQKHVFGKKLEVIRKKTFGSNIDENTVLEVDSLHNGLLENSSSPLGLTTRFTAVKAKGVDVQNMLWEEKDQGVYQMRIKASFDTRGLTFEELFANFDSFIRDIKTEFTEYEVVHSELPNTMNFEKLEQVIPIEIELNGPNG